MIHSHKSGEARNNRGGGGFGRVWIIEGLYTGEEEILVGGSYLIMSLPGRDLMLHPLGYQSSGLTWA